ncbi:MAG: radical SAM protein [Candidatus Woesearchaeota archaeon]
MDPYTVIYKLGGKNCVTRAVTFRCNNRCISCIAEPYLRKLKDSSTSQIKKILSEFSSTTSAIDINGGEPTLRSDFLHLVDFLRQRYPKAHLNILTNGRLFFYEDYVKRLKKVLPKSHMLLVTLYGQNARVHDAITRTPNSFRQTKKGIVNLVNNGLNVEVRVVVNRLNFRYLPDISTMAVNDISSLSRFVFINLKVIGDAYINRKFVFVKTSEIQPYLKKALDVLEGTSLYYKTRLFHFPFCIVERRHWDCVEGVTVPLSEIHFKSSCNLCKMRSKCSGIWKSYAEIAGTKEFRPIK